MINVRFSAADLRTIQGAESGEQLKGLKDLVLSRIEEAKTTLKMRPARESGNNQIGDKYLWREVMIDLRAVLGDKLKVPPFPDTIWYMRVNRAIKEQGMDTEYVTKLANYVKDNLNAPYSMDFIVCQHARVLAGTWGKSSQPSATKTNWLNDKLPD